MNRECARTDRLVNETPCTLFFETCIDCPALPAEPAVPETMELLGAYDWDAGANSIATHEGAQRVAFTAPAGVAGMSIGFKPSRAVQYRPETQTHAFYFFHVGALDFVSVRELGAQVLSPRARDAGDTFEIRRIGNVVTYRINDAVVHTSAARSHGTLLVNACLFGPGDSVD